MDHGTPRISARQRLRDCGSDVTGEGVFVGEPCLCLRRPVQPGILDRRTHGQRGVSMRGITASRHTTCFLVDSNDSPLEWDSAFDQPQDLRDRRSGIERTLTPPVEVAHSQIGHIEAATVAETLGNSEGHPNRSTNPVPCCQAEQETDYPLFEMLHRVTFRSPACICAA